MRASSPPSDFELGDWLVEASLCRVSRPGQVLHLRPKLTNLLVFLGRQEGRVVGKDEIFATVWQDEFVVESVLARSVADLRRLLGGHSGEPASARCRHHLVVEDGKRSRK